MSPVVTPVTPLAGTINQITQAELQYSPAVIAAILAAEQSQASGASKFQTVLNTILAGSQVAEGIPIPSVQGIGALINMSVQILNLFGQLLPHKTSTTVTLPTATMVPTVTTGNLQTATPLSFTSNVSSSRGQENPGASLIPTQEQLAAAAQAKARAAGIHPTNLEAAGQNVRTMPQAEAPFPGTIGVGGVGGQG